MSNEQFPIKIVGEIDDEYLRIVKPILKNPEFIRRRIYHHHENRSVYGHSLMVSIRAYHLAKKFNLDYESAAIAGLLHDFYYNDWQLNKQKCPIWQAHGFVHAHEAVINAYQLFPELMNQKIENAILRHMFPLTLVPPFYLESWMICVVDKWCSFEIFRQPKKLLKYVGIRTKGEDNYE